MLTNPCHVCGRPSVAAFTLCDQHAVAPDPQAIEPWRPGMPRQQHAPDPAPLDGILPLPENVDPLTDRNYRRIEAHNERIYQTMERAAAPDPAPPTGASFTGALFTEPHKHPDSIAPGIWCRIDHRAAPDPAPLDAERLARATHRLNGHVDTHSDYRGCSVCDYAAAAIAREYAKETQP